MKRRLCWLLVCGLASGAALAGERHALLIGVGDLPALPRSAWLDGPGFDVAAMRGALRQQGFAERHIETMADGAAGHAPTRAAILARLAQLEQTLGKDDVLLLYWSGHSVLAPVYPGNQATAGRRTRLLTRDSRIDSRQRMENGIASAELGRAIDALSARQVQVVAVFDTCHAAAGTRGGEGLVWRGLSSADLGWRQRAASDTPADPARARPRFVGFFAAEAQQRTPEARSTASGQAAGLFTRAVIAGLQAQPATYAIWAGSASAQYRTALQSYQLPRSAWPSPVYAGRLDAALWQAAADVNGAAPLWPVQRDAGGWQLPYGLLDGVRSGDLFEAVGARWRASEAGWHSARLELASGAPPSSSSYWARRTPAGKPTAALPALLALPPSSGAPLLDARIELALPGQPPRELPFADGDLGTLPAGTRLRISVENRGAASVDLALAHLPPGGGATPIYPALAGDSNRMPPAIGNGISRFERSFVVSGPQYGVEWLALLAAPAVNGGAPRRFAILDTQPAASQAGITRGAPGSLPSDQAQIARVSWKSVP